MGLDAWPARDVGAGARIRPVSKYPILDGSLEIRRQGDGRPKLSGSFPYNRTATVRATGRRRKESFAPRAFSFAVEDPEREINFLLGHSFDKPLASKRAGSLVLTDSDDALRFEATLPLPEDQPTHVADAVKMIEGGLLLGISPGFVVPPRSTVPDAEEEVPEPGNPGVTVRVIRQAVLLELSAVTRPAYRETTVDVRAAKSHRK